MKAVIPAAGLGTRFLPATKAQPKEMLPVVDKPTIQYVVEEAVASGVEDILIITGRGKRAIEDHFDKSFELEYYLTEKGAQDHLEGIQSIADLADIHFIRQKEPLGLGHAIYCARKHVGDEPFAVLLGDIISDAEVPCTKQLIDAHKKYGCSVIGLYEVPGERIESYGVIKGRPEGDGVYMIEDLVEKPKLEDAPSRLAIFGRYLLTPKVFDCLEMTDAGRGGEIQLTDALRILLNQEPIYGLEVTGSKFDIGDKVEWIKTTVELALRREDMGRELRQYLKDILAAQESVPE